MSQNSLLLLSLTAVFGLMVGSFLNVVILRQPKRMFFEWRQQCQLLLDSDKQVSANENKTAAEADPIKAPPGIVKQRSFCPSCEHQLSALDNIPLFSYLFLRGCCRYCKKRISIRYPLVELLTALVSALVVWHFGYSIEAVYGLIFSWVLIVLSGIDIDHQLLPDDIVLPLLWIGLIISLSGVGVSPNDAIIGAVAGYLILWSIYQLFKLLTGKEGMGYGDFKLLAVLGAWLGWQMLPLIVLLSSLLGAVIGGILLIIRRKGSQPIPFGPYLAIAGWTALLWGDKLTGFYLSYFRL
ncbi:MAG: A24 family peptidase [Xanthomonadales bacterium]|nr:A24 family peptidase [Xanthomonadales bacterium]